MTKFRRYRKETFAATATVKINEIDHSCRCTPLDVLLSNGFYSKFFLYIPFVCLTVDTKFGVVNLFSYASGSDGENGSLCSGVKV